LPLFVDFHSRSPENNRFIKTKNFLQKTIEVAIYSRILKIQRCKETGSGVLVFILREVGIEESDGTINQRKIPRALDIDIQY
jgi:hypothetical protein